MYRAGLDIGSYLAKAVIMNEEGVLSYNVTQVAGSFSKSAEKVLNEALEKSRLSLSDLDVIGGTGLGASFIAHPFVKNTEVSCQSRGIFYLLPSVRNIIDIGDQSSRVIKISDKGKVVDFIINDRCAAGSGRILQVVGKVLRISLEEMGKLSIDSANPVQFSTGCTVFAETEAISRVAEGAKISDIVAGLYYAMAIKISSMIDKIKMEGDCAVTGGGAKGVGLIKMIGKVVGKDLLVPEEPLITGAIGAALMTKEK